MNIERGKSVATSGQRVCLRRSWREMFGVRRRKDMSRKSSCYLYRSDLEICITQREIYRMLIIVLTMRQMDLACVFM